MTFKISLFTMCIYTIICVIYTVFAAVLTIVSFEKGIKQMYSQMYYEIVNHEF